MLGAHALVPVDPPVAVRAERPESIGEIVLDDPAVDVAYRLSVPGSAAVDMIDMQKRNVVLTATCARHPVVIKNSQPRLCALFRTLLVAYGAIASRGRLTLSASRTKASIATAVNLALSGLDACFDVRLRSTLESAGRAFSKSHSSGAARPKTRSRHRGTTNTVNASCRRIVPALRAFSVESFLVVVSLLLFRRDVQTPPAHLVRRGGGLPWAARTLHKRVPERRTNPSYEAKARAAPQ